MTAQESGEEQPLDIGIMMRPDILRRKQQGGTAQWHFYEGLPKVVPGRRVWVSVVSGKWAGFVIATEIVRDTQEISWDPASWVEKELPWIVYSVRDDGSESEQPYDPFTLIYTASRRRVPYSYHVPSNRLGYQVGTGRVHMGHTLHVSDKDPFTVNCLTCGTPNRQVALKRVQIEEAWPHEPPQWGRNIEPYMP